MREIEQLERGVVDEPDDRELRMVLADALSERGDPRGELLVIADRLSTGTATDAQRSRARALQHATERALAAGRAPFARLGWRRGLVERVDFVGNPQLATLAGFLRQPELRFVRELDLRTFASGTAPRR
ncbi:MAG: hypothetical protein H0T79_18450, partial [Deltaproteobacteria bacterium]|nr:hypothetical protein [Deltaproteobacteria bacterium]